MTHQRGYDAVRNPSPLTVGRLRAFLRGLPSAALIVVQDDDGHWTPTEVEHLPIGDLALGQVVLSDG